MEDVPSLWSYQESLDDLKQRLLYTNLELESVRMEANEEMRKNKESMKQLLQLLKTACQERDQARDQLQKLLSKLMPSPTTPTEFFTPLPQLHPQSPLIKSAKANSSTTESNSLSDTYNYHSPVNSFFDAVSSSPDLSNVNIADSCNLGFVSQPFVDQGCPVIDAIVKGKPLPQKGKLLQAVLGAGPLLQSLLVAGPLPRWRNPPPLQTSHIPPVSIKGCDAKIASEIPAANESRRLNPLNLSSFVEMSCGSSQMISTAPMLDFGGGGSGSSCWGSVRLISAGANANNYVPPGKRQRFL